MESWSAAELALIDAGDDLHVSPLREDGATFGTPTWIWSVVVDGGLYVRAYSGVQSRWYQAALARPDGRIRAAGADYAVTFEPTPAAMDDAIDAAYRGKYASSPYLDPMLADAVRRAGMRLVPRRG